MPVMGVYDEYVVVRCKGWLESEMLVVVILVAGPRLLGARVRHLPQ